MIPFIEDEIIRYETKHIMEATNPDKALASMVRDFIRLKNENLEYRLGARGDANELEKVKDKLRAIKAIAEKDSPRWFKVLKELEGMRL